MNLYRDGKLFGTLTRYFYETPWATAVLAPVDASAFHTLCQVSHFLNVVLETEPEGENDEEEDEAYNRWLAQLGITDADVDHFHRSAWEIRESNNRDLQGPIFLVECDSDGWIRWRW